MENQIQNDWKVSALSFPRLILDELEKKLLFQGYSRFEYLSKGIHGDILKAYSEVDSKYVQLYIEQKNINEMNSLKSEYERLVDLKNKKYIVEYLRVIYFEDIHICILISEQYDISLQDQLQSFRQHQNIWFDNNELFPIVVNLCSILQELHLNDIYHYNIQPSTIMLTSNGTYKISDLQFSIACKCNQKLAISYIKSTSKYLSPELDTIYDNSVNLADNPVNIDRLTPKTDVFSMSLVILEVLGYPVDDIIIKQIQNGDFANSNPIDGFRFSELQKLLCQHFFCPSVKQRLPSCQMMYRIVPFLQPTQQQLKDLSNELQSVIDIDPYQQQINHPYFHHLKLYYKLTQMNILEKHPKMDESNIIDSQEEVSKILIQTGDYNKALQYRLDIFHYLNVNEPNNKLKLSKAMLNLSSSYIKLKEDQNALYYGLKSLELSLAYNPAESILTAQCYFSLCWCYFGLKQTEKALECAIKSLDMKRKVYPEKDLQIALSLDSLGYIYDQMKQYQMGIQYKLEAFLIRTQQLQGNHPHLIFSYNALATSYLLQKNYQLSLEYFLKALEMKKIIYGYYHPEVMKSLTSIMNVYKYMKQLNDSNRYKEEIEQVQIKIQQKQLQ